jgi:hypothetical protein
MGKPGKTAVPFTQKHFGTKGASTDDSHVFTKSGANAMKSAALYAYGKSDKALMQKENKKEEGKETEAERRERLSVGDTGTGMLGQSHRKFAGGKIKADVGKERGATDLAVEIPKLYNKAKKKIKSLFN